MRRGGDKEEMGDSIGRWWQADVGDGCSLLAGCRCASPGPGSQVCGAEEHMKLWSYIKNLTRLITAWQLARCRAQVSRHRVWHVTPPSWKSVTIVFIWSHVVQVLYQMSPLFTILQGYQSSPNIFSMANRNVRNVTIVDIWYTFNLFGVHSKFSNILQQKLWIWWKSKKFHLGNYLQSLFQN